MKEVPTSRNSETTLSEPLRPSVRFTPGLSDQRQIFLLNVLREYDPKSVLDIGCGEGTLLEAVCQPSFALPTSLDFNARHKISEHAPIKSPEDLYGSLNVSRIAGLDIWHEGLETAIESVKAIDGASILDTWSRTRPRWSPVEVNIWKGGLQHFNAELRNYDVMLSSEVIEHLPQHILDCFCPMILGRYAPKVLAITTPGFEFNQLFTCPEPTDEHRSSPPTVRQGGYLDPTGRTNRVFRHLDHKFEWNRSEFREWCTTNASFWGYNVAISGVGRSTVCDPWGRDEPNGPPSSGGAHLFASQTAVFMRVLDDADKHRRKYESHAIRIILNLLLEESENADVKHQLLAQHNLQPHRDLTSDRPSSDNILQEVKRAISQLCHSLPGEADIWDIWNDDNVSLACQGRLERLYEAFETASGATKHDAVTGSDRACSEWKWIEPEKRTRWTRRIRWINYTPPSNNESFWYSRDCHIEEQAGASGSRPYSTILGNWDGTVGWPETMTKFDSDELPGKEEDKCDEWGSSDIAKTQYDDEYEQQAWGVSVEQQESGWGLGAPKGSA